jgi:hypothetical protein
MMRKDIKQLRVLAEKLGWTVERTKNDHLCWTAPTGERFYSASTPSNARGVLNLKSQLRKAGLPLDKHRKGGK